MTMTDKKSIEAAAGAGPSSTPGDQRLGAEPAGSLGRTGPPGPRPEFRGHHTDLRSRPEGERGSHGAHCPGSRSRPPAPHHPAGEPAAGDVLRYIEQHPVRVGLAGQPWEYPWSSAAAHVAGEVEGQLGRSLRPGTPGRQGAGPPQ